MRRFFVFILMCLYPSLHPNGYLDGAKAPGLTDRKSVHISNIDRLTIDQPRELSHRPNAHSDAGWGIALPCFGTDQKSDVAIVGVVHASRSIGQHTKSYIDCLKDSVSLNILLSSSSDYKDVPLYIKSKVITPSFKSTIDSPIVIYTDDLMEESWNVFKSFNYNGALRIVFSWADQTKLEPVFVERLNKNFDVVLVPDNFLVKVYKKSGVKKPIFVLPETIDLNPFLSRPIKVKKKQPFIFGCSAIFTHRKNHELLVRAFAEAFHNDPLVKLRLHGKRGVRFESIEKLVKDLHLTNVELILQEYTREEYVNFISSLDCYVLVSRAEGFSITPREALASGIPCIISNNTAHQTICDSGYVYPVSSRIKVKLAANRGYQYTCHTTDVSKAMRKVYQDYDQYLDLAKKGRDWTKQYLPCNLSPLYRMLVKPKKVILGKRNELTKDALITEDLILYTKYKKLIQN